MRKRIYQILFVMIAANLSTHSMRLTKGIIERFTNMERLETMDSGNSRRNSKGNMKPSNVSALATHQIRRLEFLKSKLKEKLPLMNSTHAEVEEKDSEVSEPGNPQSNSKKSKAGSFTCLGISPETIRALVYLGYRHPTPIQNLVIPPILHGKDVVAMARTGSGKTAAFMVPIICRISNFTLKARESGRVSGVQCVVLEPTRELAVQTFTFCKKYSKFTTLTSIVISGGESMEAQFAALAANPEILVATPGRLMQMVREVPTLTLRTVRICVLDEADRLFEGSLIAVVQQLLQQMAQRRIKQVGEMLVEDGQLALAPARHGPHIQTVLVSATLPRELAEFARTGLSADRVVVRLDAAELLPHTLRVGFLFIGVADRLACLLFLICDVVVDPAGMEQPGHSDARFGSRGLVVRRFSADAQRRRIEAAEAANGPDGSAAAMAVAAPGVRRRCLVFCATRHGVEVVLVVLREVRGPRRGPGLA